MISKNKENLYLELEEDLKKERNYIPNKHKEEILDMILDKTESVDIYYIYSNTYSNSIRFFSENAIVIWDMNFWKCFEDYLMQAENCKRLNMNITQGIIAVISQALSHRYENIPEISSFLLQIPREFGIELQSIDKYYDKMHNIVQIGKLFSLFHEFGHMEYRKRNSDKIAVCEELVVDLIGALDKKDFLPLGEWANLGWKSACLVKEKKNAHILEELACDVFSAMNLVDYYKVDSNKGGFRLACECVIAVEYLSTFQNMFNAVNQAWDSHYTEMRFRLAVREKEVDSYINDLAMARYGLCGLILVIVICNMLNVDRRDREKLWGYRDNNHIDNEDVIACLADEDFIREAIEDAFG